MCADTHGMLSFCRSLMSCTMFTCKVPFFIYLIATAFYSYCVFCLSCIFVLAVLPWVSTELQTLHSYLIVGFFCQVYGVCLYGSSFVMFDFEWVSYHVSLSLSFFFSLSLFWYAETEQFRL